MKIFSAANRATHFIEKSLIVIFLSVMVTLAFLQVILRNFFSYGFLWADPLLRYMVMWVGFLGAVIATREGKHFGVDFLNRYLPVKVMRWVKIGIDLFASAVSCYLMYAAFQFLYEAIGPEETDVFEIPKRFYFLIIPVGFGLIGVQFLFNVAEDVKKIFSAEPNGGAAEPPHTFF